MTRKLWTIGEAIAELSKVLPRIDDLLLSEQEALACSGRPTVEGAFEAFAALGLRTVVIKRGLQGAVAYRDGRIYTAAAYPGAHVVDTVGAGDAFNAGDLYGELIGLDLDRASELGNWAAAQVIAHPGDYEGFPRKADCERFLSGIEPARRWLTPTRDRCSCQLAASWNAARSR